MKKREALEKKRERPGKNKNNIARNEYRKEEPAKAPLRARGRKESSLRRKKKRTAKTRGKGRSAIGKESLLPNEKGPRRGDLRESRKGENRLLS